MKTILITAYAVNPFKGSEDGMGWNFILQAAKFNKVIAITRVNNKKAIEDYIRETENTAYVNIQWVYYDRAELLLRLKRITKWHLFYYWLWQQGLPEFIAKNKFSFDLVHNLNFHNDWTPSYLWKLDKPFVWGPVGHHNKIDFTFIKSYGLYEFLADRAKWMVKWCFWNFSRDLRNTIHHSSKILVMNSDVSQRLKIKEKAITLPSVGIEVAPLQIAELSNGYTFVSSGRFVPLKGFDLTLRSFHAFLKMLSFPKNCRLILVGTGPYHKSILKLIKELGISDFVQVYDWMPRNEYLALLSGAKVFLFPSHEGAGMVVAEALNSGLPVVCLDNYGPGEFINEDCGIKVSKTTYEGTISGLTSALCRLYNSPSLWLKLSEGARLHAQRFFSWDQKGLALQRIYSDILK